MRTIATLLAGGLLAAFVGASAGPSIAQSQPLAPSDQALVGALLQEARGQIAFARYAEPRAETDAVQQLAQTTLSQWSALADRLDAIAVAHGDPVPTALTPAQQRILDELGQTHPEDFDTAYVRVAETDYQRAVAAFGAAPAAADPQITTTIDAARPAFERLDRETNADPMLPGTY